MNIFVIWLLIIEEPFLWPFLVLLQWSVDLFYSILSDDHHL